MGKERKKQEELTPEEVEEQNGEELPERTAMTVLNPPLIYGPAIPDDDGLLGGGPPVDPTNS
jgi:hypothetical protein